MFLKEFDLTLVGAAAKGRAALFRKYKVPHRNMSDVCFKTVVATHRVQQENRASHWGMRDSFGAGSIETLLTEVLSFIDPAGENFSARVHAGLQARLEDAALRQDAVWSRRILDLCTALPDAAVLGAATRKLASIEPDIVKTIIECFARTFLPGTKEIQNIQRLLLRTTLYPWRLEFGQAKC